jgi:hypothetical protein
MRQHLPYYAIAAAILVVGLAAMGVPVTNLFYLGLIIICPLMVLLMMRGMHGGGNGNDSRSNDDDSPQERDHTSHLGR